MFIIDSYNRKRKDSWNTFQELSKGDVELYTHILTILLNTVQDNKCGKCGNCQPIFLQLPLKILYIFVYV